MDRRTALRQLAAIAALPLVGHATADDLLAIGERLHARGSAGPSGPGLDAHQRRTVTVLAEHIIPETDTPGATAAGVPGFIDRIVADWYRDDERAAFLSGLADVDARCREAWGREFVDCSPGERIELLEALDAEATAARESGGDRDEHFFRRMKWLTLWGYYTSEAGATQELHYRVIPGRYEGCAPMTDPAHT